MVEKTTESFKVKLEGFEGPFDILLHLIEEQKVAIYDISINKITAGYLEYLHSLQELDLEVTSEFMVMAALLIEMKSKMLLPADNPDNESILAEAEKEKTELLGKLVEYKAFKLLTKQLLDREHDNAYVHTRETINQELIDTLSPEKIVHLRNANTADLVKAFNKVWQDFELRLMTHDFKHVSQRSYSIKDKMHEIVERLKRAHSHILFTELFNDIDNKFEIIASFIAILELVRQQFIHIMQNDVFDDIQIIARRNIDEKAIVIDDTEYNTIQGVTPA